LSIEKKLSKLIDSVLDNNSKVDNNNNPEKNESIENTAAKQAKNIAKAEEDFDKKDDNKKYSEPGKVWVENNKVYVKGLPGKNSLPTLQPTNKLNLFVNGKLIKTKVKVSEHDQIEVVPLSKEIPFDIKITISKDNLTAYMQIQLNTTWHYSLIDQPPQENLILLTTENKTQHLPLSLDDIIDYIKKANVTYGLDFGVIQEFISNPRNEKIVIAKGVAPSESKDDKIDLLFPEKVVKKQFSAEEKIDFRNMKTIPSVDENELLAIKHDGYTGKSGISVTGEIILPRKHKKIYLRAGKGVCIKNNCVYSTKAGWPKVRKLGSVWLFYINEYLTHKGDIDLSVGNIKFHGNIQIVGNVNDNMTIIAGGNLQITDNVMRATILAMESIWINKCIGAQVMAGGNSYYFNSCYHALQELNINVKQLCQAINHLIELPQFREFKEKPRLIILLLIEKKFNVIPQLIKKINDYIEVMPFKMPPDIVELTLQLQESILPWDISVKKIHKLHQYVELMQDYFKQLQDIKANVYIDYTFNSTITANTDVYIRGQGSFNSKITANGKVYVSGTVRGSEVYGSKGITVNVAGSEMGTPNILKTDANSAITILEKIHDGVIIQIGKKIYKNISPVRGPIKFTYDKNDDKIISS
jgi:hypothetical protein